MADRERLMLALKSTEALAEEGLHDQNIWVQRDECGTRCCFAGNWALVNGHEPVTSRYTQDIRITVGDRVWILQDWVLHDLELSYTQGSLLFFDSASLEELQEHVAMILQLQDNGLDDEAMDEAIAEYLWVSQQASLDAEDMG